MRILLALLVIIAGIATAVFFADHPGAVSLVWQGWRVDTSVGVLAFGFGVALLVGWIVLRLVGLLVAAPRRIGLRRREGRALLGYRAMTDGLVALAAGDVRGAERLRLKAEDHFTRGKHPIPPLTRLLSAQAALLRGDHATAHLEFTAMLESPETEFLGLRGLIMQALKAGDDATALALTERANRLRPNTAWVLQSQLALQTRAGAWRSAEATLAEAVKRKALPTEEGQRHRLALLLARSTEAEQADKPREALKHALGANATDRAFAPAAVRAAALLVAAGRTGRAAKIIEVAWIREPHPSLADAYRRVFQELPPAERLKKLERLIGLRTSEPVGHLAAASLALEARLWGEARRHLQAAGSSAEGPWPHRLCILMAELEEQESLDPAEAALWASRADRAAPDAQWVCAICRTAAARWSPHCPECQAFDTLSWGAQGISAARPGFAHGAPSESVLPILELDVPSGREISRVSATSSGVAAESAARGAGV